LPVLMLFVSDFLLSRANANEITDFQSANTITSAFLGLLKNPSVIARAQAELDSVVSGLRLPSFEDRPRMPYVEAIVLESLRWVPALPLGLPHMTSADDEYRGYLIPKGTTVMCNAWCVLVDPTDNCRLIILLARAVLHNPNNYPEPEVFNPERFLKEVNGKWELDPTVLDPHVVAFGAGRR
jgi:cytochrome P450